MDYLTAEDVLLIAEVALGAPAQARDLGLIDSACHRPAAEMCGQEAYPDLLTKAAGLLQSLTNNHPLLDGNKRTAWLSTLTFLELNGATLDVADGYDSKGAKLVLDIAPGWVREVDVIAAELRRIGVQPPAE